MLSSTFHVVVGSEKQGASTSNPVESQPKIRMCNAFPDCTKLAFACVSARYAGVSPLARDLSSQEPLTFEVVYGDTKWNTNTGIFSDSGVWQCDLALGTVIALIIRGG